MSVISLELTGQHITPVNVFMLLAFINVLRSATCVDFAQSFLGIFDAYASLGRIKHFLLLENLSAVSQDQLSESTSKAKSYSIRLKRGLTDHHETIKTEFRDHDKPLTLCVSSLTYKENKRENEFILQDIEFTRRIKSVIPKSISVGVFFRTRK